MGTKEELQAQLKELEEEQEKLTKRYLSANEEADKLAKDAKNDYESLTKFSNARKRAERIRKELDTILDKHAEIKERLKMLS